MIFLFEHTVSISLVVNQSLKKKVNLPQLFHASQIAYFEELSISEVQNNKIRKFKMAAERTMIRLKIKGFQLLIAAE